MDNRYRELMDRVELGVEGRQRILTGIARRKKHSRLPLGILSAAACLMIVLGLSVYLQQPPVTQQRPQRPVTMVGSGNPMAAVTREEVEAEVGFSIYEAENLPFQPQQTEYRIVNGAAQTIYRSADQSAVLTQSRTEIVPESAEHQDTEEVWQRDGFWFSLKMSHPMDEAGWTEVLSGIRKGETP